MAERSTFAEVAFPAVVMFAALGAFYVCATTGGGQLQRGFGFPECAT